MVAPLARRAGKELGPVGVRFTCEIRVPASRDDVFRFFSDALNLERITPPWLKFRLITPPPIVLARGATIDYRLRIHGLPLAWQSEITVWDPPAEFVDEQRRGPYRRWVHRHTFAAAGANATFVRDAVEFEAPFELVTGWFVRRDVERIFAYRSAALRKIFG